MELENCAALSAVEARRLIGNGDLSPVDLLESCIERVDVLDPVVNAMITRNFDAAREAARDAERAVRNGSPVGPLHGLPVAIKDIQATEGLRTTYGSPQFADNVPDADDGIVARVRAAGGIVIGKTNVPERSIGANTINRLFGATGNPYAPHLTCGGSSGGSAVAVATGMAPLATGSDHGGSLRIPASYSGVVGFRASPGVVPNEQRYIAQTNYSLQGPMARSVADVALLLSVIAGRDHGGHLDPMAFPQDAGQFASLDPVDLSGLRVAASADLGGVLVSEAVRADFTRRVESLAVHVDRLDMHDLDLTGAPDVDWHLRQDVFVAQYAEEAAHWDAGFNPNVRATYESALTTPMEQIAHARRRQVELFRATAKVFDDYDMLLVPGVSVPPFPWTQLNPETIDGHPVQNYMAWLALTASLTVVGHPVVALPWGSQDAEGIAVPFGVQVVGPAYGDKRLLCIAAALERWLAETGQGLTLDPDRLAATESECRTAGKTVYR